MPIVFILFFFKYEVHLRKQNWHCQSNCGMTWLLNCLYPPHSMNCLTGIMCTDNTVCLVFSSGRTNFVLTFSGVCNSQSFYRRLPFLFISNLQQSISKIYEIFHMSKILAIVAACKSQFQILHGIMIWLWFYAMFINISQCDHSASLHTREEVYSVNSLFSTSQDLLQYPNLVRNSKWSPCGWYIGLPAIGAKIQAAEKRKDH